jgi:HemY protein
MWKAFWSLLIVFVLAGFVAFFANNPGEFVVHVGGYRIETSFVLFSGFLIASLALILFAIWSVLRILRGPGALLLSHRNRRRAQGHEALRQGLVAVAAGNPSEVRKLAARANSLLDDPPLTLLLSAQAAQLEGDDKRASKAYRKMLDNPETEFLGLRGLFIQSVKSRSRSQALGFAERAFELQPETPWVIDAVFELQSAVGEWAAAAETLEQSVKSNHIAADVAKRKRAVLYTEQAMGAQRKNEAEEAEIWGKKAADLSPGLVPASVLSARHAIRQGNLWKAAEVVEKAWTAQPHPDLADVYAKARKVKQTGDILGDAEIQKDKKAEAKWLRGLADFNKDHIESRLLRARQDLKLGRRRAARKVLKGLAENYATVRVCQLMADVEAAEPGQVEENARAVRRWLNKAVSAPRDAHWMCETCGREARGWGSTCTNCGAFDSLSWKAPADLVADLVLEPVDVTDIEEETPLSDLVHPEGKPSLANAPSKSPPKVPETFKEGPTATSVETSTEAPVIVDVTPEVLDHASPPSENPKEGSDSNSVEIEASKEVEDPERSKGFNEPVKPARETTRDPLQNPLFKESAAHGKVAIEEGAAIMPPLPDDPGPDADDPFTDESGEAKW